MKLQRILNYVYNKPWAITPEAHKAIQQVIEAKLAGSQLNPFDLQEEEQSAGIEKVGSVALLPIEGTILPRASGLEALCGAFSLEQFKANLKEAAADESVKSIVLDINSPGGVITGVPEASDLISEVAKTKPVYAYTSDTMASAAYWLASQATAIFASKSAEVGSIGVYTAFLDATRAMEMEGVKLELFKAGKFKAMGIAGKPLSDEERDLIQAGVDKAYDQFTSYVVAKRKNVGNDSMQGQMFDAEEAFQAGLIDGEINELDSLIEFLIR